VITFEVYVVTGDHVDGLVGARECFSPWLHMRCWTMNRFRFLDASRLQALPCVSKTWSTYA
jgi:hypothetical protein